LAKEAAAKAEQERLEAEKTKAGIGGMLYEGVMGIPSAVKKSLQLAFSKTGCEKGSVCEHCAKFWGRTHAGILHGKQLVSANGARAYKFIDQSVDKVAARIQSMAPSYAHYVPKKATKNGLGAVGLLLLLIVVYKMLRCVCRRRKTETAKVGAESAPVSSTVAGKAASPKAASPTAVKAATASPKPVATKPSQGSASRTQTPPPRGSAVARGQAALGRT